MNQMSDSLTPVEIVLTGDYIEKFNASFAYLITFNGSSYAIIKGEEQGNLYILRVEVIDGKQELHDIEDESEFQSVLTCFLNIIENSND